MRTITSIQTHLVVRFICSGGFLCFAKISDTMLRRVVASESEPGSNSVLTAKLMRHSGIPIT